MGWVVNAMSRPLNPREDNRYRLYRGLGGPQGRSGRGLKQTSHENLRPTEQGTQSSIHTPHRHNYLVSTVQNAGLLYVIEHLEEYKVRSKYVVLKTTYCYCNNYYISI